MPIALSTAQAYGASTEFLGSWGQDAAGTQIATDLAARGVAIDHCQVDTGTGFAQIWTESATGTRTIAAFPGPELDLTQLPKYLQVAEQADILHLDGSSGDVAVRLAQTIKQRGGCVVLDAGSKKPGTATLLPLVDVLIASNLFCRSWFGTEDVPTAKLLDLGCGAVIRTQGAAGAVYYDGKRKIMESGIAIDAVDTNGAGDIFSGAWLFGLWSGWSTEKQLRFANRVAGFSCGHRGNTTLPSREEIGL